MRQPLLRSLLGCLCLTAKLWAQPAAPEQPPAVASPPASGASSEAKAAPGQEGAQRPPGEAAPAATSGPKSEPTETEAPKAGTAKPKKTAEPPPPLPEPRASDQLPHPVFVPPEPEPRARDLDLGVASGLWWHASREREGMSYQPALFWGAHARIEPLPWLGIRALVLSLRHPVSVGRGALGPTPDTRVDQDAVRAVMLAAELEPTWAVTQRLALWGGLGVGWSTLAAPAPEARSSSIQSARRTGVLIDGWVSLGATYELVARWMTGSLLVLGGLPLNQSGAIFEPVQALRQEPPAEAIDYYAGLPEFGASLAAMASVGLLL